MQVLRLPSTTILPHDADSPLIFRDALAAMPAGVMGSTVLNLLAAPTDGGRAPSALWQAPALTTMRLPGGAPAKSPFSYALTAALQNAKLMTPTEAKACDTELVKESARQRQNEITKALFTLRRLETMDLTPDDAVSLFYAYKSFGAFADMARFYEAATDPRFKNKNAIRELYIVALNKTGRLSDSIAIAESFVAEGAATGEMLAGLGKAYREMARKNPDANEKERLLVRSYDYYLKGYLIAEEYYPGINAVYNLIELGQEKRAGELAVIVYDATLKAGGKSSTDYWCRTTMLELAVILGSHDEAFDMIPRLLRVAKAEWEIDSTLAQLRMLQTRRANAGSDIELITLVIKELELRKGALGLDPGLTNPDFITAGPLSPARVAEIQTDIAVHGPLTPVKELRPLVKKMEALFKSDGFLQAIGESVPLLRLKNLIETEFYHLELMFQSHIDSPSYRVPFSSPYPVRYTIVALERAQSFLQNIDRAFGTDFSGTIYSAIDQDNVATLKALTDQAMAEKAARTEPYTDYAADPLDDRTPEQRMIANPIGEYGRMRERLLRQGENAAFPEFKPTVDAVLTTLRGMRATDPIFEKYPEMRILQESVIARLEKLGGVYPYRETINAILDTLFLLDSIERTKYTASSDYHKVERSWLGGDPAERKIEPLYHVDRYFYHWFSIASDPNAVLFPTVYPLDFMDLVKVRPVPIGLLGIEARTVWGDRHYQSPLDFLIHDVNHVRRMNGSMNGALARAQAVTEKEKFAIYKQMNDLVQKIVAETEPSTLAASANHAAAEDFAVSEGLKKIVRAIGFEILHESALAATRELMVYDMMRTPGTPQPFEYFSMEPKRFSNQELEARRRTDSGSLASGRRYMLKLAPDGTTQADSPAKKVFHAPMHVHYILDRALSFLSTVMNKLNHNFFDSSYDPNEEFVPVKYRTPEMVARAAHMLFAIIDRPSPGLETLTQWAASTDGNLERFKKYTTREDAQALGLSVGSFALPGSIK